MPETGFGLECCAFVISTMRHWGQSSIFECPLRTLSALALRPDLQCPLPQMESRRGILLQPGYRIGPRLQIQVAFQDRDVLVSEPDAGRGSADTAPHPWPIGHGPGAPSCRLPGPAGAHRSEPVGDLASCGENALRGLARQGSDSVPQASGPADQGHTSPWDWGSEKRPTVPCCSRPHPLPPPSSA